MNNNFKVQTISVDCTDIKTTAERARKILALPAKELYNLKRIYGDGTFFEFNVPQEKIYDVVAYDATYRNEAALLLEDTLIFTGNIPKDSLPILISEIIKRASYKKLQTLFAAS